MLPLELGLILFVSHGLMYFLQGDCDVGISVLFCRGEHWGTEKLSDLIYQYEAQNSRSFPTECYMRRITEKKAELGVRLTTVAQTSFDIKSLALTQGLGQFDVACYVGLIAVPGSQGWKHFIQNGGGLVQPLQMPTHCVLPPTFLHCTQLPENCKLRAHLGTKSLVWRVMFSSWEQTRQQQGWLHVTVLRAPIRITLRTCRNNWCLSSDSLETEPETGFNWKAVYWDGNNVLPKHKIGY